MSNSDFHLRAHHGMCLHYFVGEGYSSTFSQNMWEIKKYLEENNPLVTIVDHTDKVCSSCPNNIGKCISDVKVNKYDKKVLEFCGLKADNKIRFRDFEALVDEQILSKGNRSLICGDCQWNKLCQ